MRASTPHRPQHPLAVLAGAGATVWLTTYGARVVTGAIALGSRR